MLGLCWGGPSWSHVGPKLGHLGAMLGARGCPSNFLFFRFMLFFSKSQKHRKLLGFSVAEHRSAVGAGSRIAKATAFGRGRCPSTGPAGPI